MSAGVINELPHRPRLKTTIDLFAASDGTVYLLRPGGEGDLAIRDAGDQVRGLIEALDGERTLCELERALGPDVAPTVAQLQELALVEDAALDEELGAEASERYNRQLAYFGELAGPGESRTAPQRRLAEARVTVIGLGGLGSWIVYALACAGVGRIDGIDGDRVELSNLNRQILYQRAQVGMPKAQAAARAIGAFNPSIEFRALARRLSGREEVEEVVAGADFVVEAADWPLYRIGRWVNAACFAQGVPYIAASQFPPLVRIGPTYVPGETGCLECQEAEHRRDFPLFDELVESQGRRSSNAATFGPACAVIGGLVASDVVHHLGGLNRPATWGEAVFMDLRTLDQRWEPVPREAGCPVCGGVPVAAGG